MWRYNVQFWTLLFLTSSSSPGPPARSWPMDLSLALCPVLLGGQDGDRVEEVTECCSLGPEEKGRGSWTGNRVSCVLGLEPQHGKGG